LKFKTINDSGIILVSWLLEMICSLDH